MIDRLGCVACAARWALALWLLAWVVAAAASNRLADHPSPYLALHGGDPVHWQPWEPAVLERARREGKLILVSVGYFACHWCHVMQRESYQDAEIARQLNGQFIAVKVDRELEPVLDQRLQDFAQTVNGIGGWPLNAFLTPEGYPLSAVLYLPRDEFSRYLDRLGTRWRADRERLSTAAREMSERVASARQANESTTGQPAVASLGPALVKAALEEADRLQGGFGQETKFPMVPQLWALLEIQARRPDAEVAAFLRTTLEHMADLGLYDHIGDGFFRYTTDPDWRTPHFEKMLYDNALLAWLYLRASEVLGEPRYRAVGLATLRFMIRDMRGEGGALVASLSAIDDRGVEGGVYLWRAEDLDRLLSPPERRLASLAWGLNRPAQWEAGTLPIMWATAEAVRKQLNLSEAAHRAAMAAIKDKLLQARATRLLPRDDKRLAGWNGLALLALAEGARHSPEFRSPAATLARFLKSLWNGEVLPRAVDQRGRSLGPGTLGDYAGVALGLLAWSDVDRDRGAAEVARALLHTALRTYRTPVGWLEDSADLLPGAVVNAHLPDSVLLSAETLWLLAARKAALITRDETLDRVLQSLLGQASIAMGLEPFRYASLIATAQNP